MGAVVGTLYPAGRQAGPGPGGERMAGDAGGRTQQEVRRCGRQNGIGGRW